jgi:hypothetical protein
MMTKLFTDDQVELVLSVGARLPDHLLDQFLLTIVCRLISSTPDEEFAGAVFGAWESASKPRTGGWDVLI